MTRHLHEVITLAGAGLGLNTTGARLVAASSRLIWHLPNERVALTVSRPGAKTESNVMSEIAAIEAAIAAGVRTPQLVAGPIALAEQRYAVALEWVAGRPPNPSDWSLIASEAARLAAAPASRTVALLQWPPALPNERIRTMLGDRLFDVFVARCATAAQTIESLIRSGPLSLNHGDLQPGNVIVDGDGRPWLIDLEYACRAPREWDAAKLDILSRRFGDPHTVSGLLAAWGRLDQDRLSYCVAAQEMLLVAWLTRMALDGTTGALDEARHRIATMSDRRTKWHHLALLRE
jgi:Ser/Thr protein kinase RdoA (MazF antagonist)